MCSERHLHHAEISFEGKYELAGWVKVTFCYRQREYSVSGIEGIENYKKLIKGWVKGILCKCVERWEQKICCCNQKNHGGLDGGHQLNQSCVYRVVSIETALTAIRECVKGRSISLEAGSPHSGSITLKLKMKTMMFFIVCFCLFC